MNDMTFNQVIQNPHSHLFKQPLTREEEEILEKSRAIMRKLAMEDPHIASPEVAAEYARQIIGACDREIVSVLHLTAHNEALAFEDLFSGGTGSSICDMKILALSILKHKSEAIVLFHNHPGGCSRLPSRADLSTTARIQELCAILGVRLYDHIIVNCKEGYYSFLEHGQL